jgi:hypothetical protein
MSFFQTRNPDEKKFEKTPFLVFDFGQHVIRILGKPKVHFLHFLPRQKMMVSCLGPDCPICANNKQIIFEHKENFRDIPGYMGRQTRHYFNVLDRTAVKVCPQCETEAKRGPNGQFPAACPECNTYLTGEKERPSNKVKVASISETNADLLNQYAIGENGEELILNDFDIMFYVTKSGQKKVITPSPVKDNNDKVDIPEDQLFDLDNVVIRLNPTEMVEAVKGVSFKDIFAARRVSTPVVAGDDDLSALEAKAEQVSADIDEKINKLFS